MQSDEGVNERIDEGIFRWFSHVERVEKGRIAKRVYVESVLIVAQCLGLGRGGLIS